MKTARVGSTRSLGLTLFEVSNILGISQEKVRQIERNALRKLASPKLKDKWISVMETVAMMQRGY